MATTCAAVADRLEVSRSTITRWANLAGIPGGSGRPREWPADDLRVLLVAHRLVEDARGYSIGWSGNRSTACADERRRAWTAALPARDHPGGVLVVTSSGSLAVDTLEEAVALARAGEGVTRIVRIPA